jgi:hypothetical protein
MSGGIREGEQSKRERIEKWRLKIFAKHMVFNWRFVMNKKRRREIMSTINMAEKIQKEFEDVQGPVNKEQKDQLMSKLNKLLKIVSDILSDEEYSFYNMPDGLQESDNGIVSQEAQENLGEAVNSLYEAITLLNDGFINDDAIDAIIDAIIYMEDSV